MIDMMGNKTYSGSALKARSMSRLQESIGYEELIAALARAVFALRGDYVLSPETDAQLTEIAGAMAAEEVTWLQEIADNDLLIAVIAYENAEARLSMDLVVASVIDPETNLPVNQFELDRDAAEREAASNVIATATPETLTLVSERQAARDAALLDATP